MMADFKISEFSSSTNVTLSHSQTLRQNPAIIYLASLGSPLSQQNMRYTLEHIARCVSSGRADINSFPWHDMKRSDVLAILSFFQSQSPSLSPARLRTYLVVLKRVAAEAWYLQQLSLEDLEAIRQIKPPKGSRLKKGRVLELEEQRALINGCDTGTNKGLRDSALLALALTTGLRRSEIVGLDLNSIDYATGEMRVIGKGNKQRLLIVKHATLKRIARYIKVRGLQDGALFYRVLKSGEFVHQRLSAQAIYNIVEDACLRAGLCVVRPHDLRKTFGTMLDINGTSMTTIKDMLGHSDISTTDDYILRDDKKIREAVESLSDL